MIPNKVYLLIDTYLPVIALFTFVLIITRAAYILYGKKEINVAAELKNLVYILYILSLFILVTTTDFSGGTNNFIPFEEILRYDIHSVLFYRNVIGNILLFMPFGLLVTDMIKENCKKYNVLVTMIITFLTSLAIEFIQMRIGRSFDVDDILLNTLGGVLGFLIFYLFDKVFKKITKEKYNMLLGFLLYTVGIIIFILIALKLYGVI